MLCLRTNLWANPTHLPKLLKMFTQEQGPHLVYGNLMSGGESILKTQKNILVKSEIITVSSKLSKQTADVTISCRAR